MPPQPSPSKLQDAARAALIEHGGEPALIQLEETFQSRLHGIRQGREFRRQHAAQAHPLVCKDGGVDVHITPQLCRCSPAIGINF